jgi:hypothetical protein
MGCVCSELGGCHVLPGRQYCIDDVMVLEGSKSAQVLLLTKI